MPVDFAVDRVRSVLRNGKEPDNERVQGAGGDDPGKQSPLVSSRHQRVAGARTHRVALASTPPVSQPRPAPTAPAPAIAAKVIFLVLPCGKLVPTMPAAAGDATAKPAPANARAKLRPMMFWWGQTCYSGCNHRHETADGDPDGAKRDSEQVRRAQPVDVTHSTRHESKAALRRISQA